MTKISLLPALQPAEIDGSETVPVVKAGLTRRAPLVSLLVQANRPNAQNAAVRKAYIEGAAQVGLAAPGGSSASQTNGSWDSLNTLAWHDDQAFTVDGYVTELPVNLRGAGANLPIYVFSGTGVNLKIEAIVNVNTAGWAAYATQVAYAGTHFDAFSVKKGWRWGRLRQANTAYVTSLEEAGAGINYVAGLGNAPAVGATLARTGTANGHRLQMGATIASVVDAKVFEARSVARQAAKAAQDERNSLERCEMTPLRKLRRKIALGLPVIVSAFGTSIANASIGTVGKLAQSLAREFGQARGSTGSFGTAGGGVTGTHNGWARQDFGGPKFLRLRGSPTSTAFTEDMYGDTIRIWYSLEADGGSFVVNVKSGSDTQGTDHVINCNGAQRYWQLLEIAVPLGGHRVTYNPPSSGYAYLEWRESVDSAKPGVHFRDATLGGSSLRDCRYRSISTGGPAPIATVGTNGLDASIHADADLAIIQWHVNDAGASGTWATGGSYKADLDYLVDGYVAASVPVLVVIELGGHYRKPASPFAAAYIAIKKAIQRQARKTNVWVIDWDQELRSSAYDDLDHFLASFYNVDQGDEIHPVSAGYRPCDDQVTRLTGVKVPHDSTLILERARVFRHLPDELAGLAKVTVDGAAKFLMPKGAGRNMVPGAEWRDIVYLDPEATNYFAAWVAANIDGQPTKDRWGTFRAVDAGGGAGIGHVNYIGAPGDYWVVIRARGAINLRMQSTVGRFLYPNGTVNGFTGLYSPAASAGNDEPGLHIGKIRVTAPGNFEIRYGEGALYDLCMVRAETTTAPLTVR